MFRANRLRSLFFGASQTFFLIPGNVGNSPAQQLPNLQQLPQAVSAQLTVPSTAQQSPANAFSAVLNSLTQVFDRITSFLTKILDAIKANQQPATPAPTTTPTTTPATTTTPSTTTPSTTAPDVMTPMLIQCEFSVAERRTYSQAGLKQKVSETELRRGVLVWQLYQKDAKLADTFDAAYNKARTEGDADELRCSVSWCRTNSSRKAMRTGSYSLVILRGTVRGLRFRLQHEHDRSTWPRRQCCDQVVGELLPGFSWKYYGKTFHDCSP